ncbi:MAG: M20/M25/M40 family metallo-hydrolase [Syntrophomonadaceae bacterium]|nr:M20/M25/M40 family metallo-hydrolase [Syntrophomonadaceae bacterium]
MLHAKTGIKFDLNKAAEHLASAIRFKTVSYPDNSLIDFAQYNGFLQFLTEAYPEIHRVCEITMINNYSPMFRWQGSDGKGLKPILLLGHYDVVPAIEDDGVWLEPPFSGVIKGNYIWGRGAIDNKGQVIAILEAIEHLIESGFQPERDIYITLGFDEEIGGSMGAVKTAAYFKEKNIEFDCVLDEGGCIVTDIMDGLKVPAALIGIAEKATANFKISVSGQGGHSSMPPANTAIGTLAKIISNLENHPMPARLIMPVREMFKKMAPYMENNKLVLKSIDKLFPAVSSVLSKNPATNSMIRTTFAATMIGGGYAPNVLPPEAWAIVNARVLQGDSINGVMEHIRKVNPGIEFTLEKLMGEDPGNISPIDSPAYKTIEKILGEMFPEVLVLPYLMAGATDSRNYAGVSKGIYRFAAMVLNKELYATIHSENERLSFDNLASMMEFYYKLITMFE